MNKHYYVYLMTNKNNTVKIIKGFTEKYNIVKLVYYEIFNNPYDAISREKQIKAGSRKRKIDLINKVNLKWKDLYFEL